MSVATENTGKGPTQTPQPTPVAQKPASNEVQPERKELHSELGNANLSAAMGGSSPADIPLAATFQSRLGNAALAHLLIQRKAEDATPAPTQPAEPTVSSSMAALIVEDNAQVNAGQMQKTEFLAQLRTSVIKAAEDAFAGTPWTEAGCPYIDRVFAFYSTQDSQRVERSIRKYAPEVAGVTTASAMIPLITARVQRSLTTWVKTGQITGVPEGMPSPSIAGLAGVLGGALSGIAGTGAAPVENRSGTKDVLFKHKPGETSEAVDPQVVQSQLGTGQTLDAGVRSKMESAFGRSFGDVQVHTDASAGKLAKDFNARAFTVGRDVAFGTGQYQPGTLIGDALIAHELAHVSQQRGAKPGEVAPKGESGYSALEEDADLAAVSATVSIWGKTKAGLSQIARNAKPNLRSGLRLQRCNVVEAPTNLTTAEQKAAWITKAMKEDELGTSRAIVDVFKTSETPAEFLAIQEHLDVAALIEYLPDWEAIQIGTLGPVLAGQAKLNEKRAAFIVRASHDYGVNRGQAFVHQMFATMYTDDMRAVLKILAADKRLKQTILLMDAVKELITERGIKPEEYQDRPEELKDAARGVGQFFSDFMNSSELGKSGTASRYYSQKAGLPDEYQDLLSEIEKREFEAAMSPGNVFFGTLDYVTFGIVGGAVGLVKGTVKGTWDVAHGEYEQGAYELTGAALVLATFLGVKAYRRLSGPKTVMGPEGPGQFVIQGFQGPIPKEVARLGAIVALNPEAQAVAGLVLSRIGRDGVLKVANYVQADSQAAILVHQRGLIAIEALYKAEGNVAKARAMLPPKPAGLLPATTEAIESQVPKKVTPDLPEPKPETKTKPETKPPAREPTPERKAEIKPPPVNAKGQFDFTGRTNKELARDAAARPYDGETISQAQARAAQAQAEVLSKLPGLKPCFVAGTPVLTPDGPTAIEKLKAGKLVMVMDPAGPAVVTVQEILEVFSGTTNRLCQLSADGQSIHVTPNHRFFVVGAGWKQADQLTAGDLLLTPSGESIIIDAVEHQHLTEAVATFNLRVAVIPTYFVGSPTSVLAHNNGPDFNRTLWWLLDNKAKFRKEDTDGPSLWKTESAEDVNDLFKIRRSYRSADDHHQAYTPEQLRANGIQVDHTPGDGPLNGRLQHGSARPQGVTGELSKLAITDTVAGINKTEPAVKATPKSMGCP